MSKELRAAAERLINEPHGNRDAGYGASPQRINDERWVAQEYLAEHPADDADYPDGEWLLAVLPVSYSGTDRAHVDVIEQGTVVACVDFLWSDGCTICHINLQLFREMKTRKQVRDLCRGLGITLKGAS
jgi:hypothetical protein